MYNNFIKGGDKMDMKIKRGQILRQLRLARHLTQNEAAENFGISQQTYQKYESGKTEPPYDLLCDFSVFYGVTTDYLLGLNPPPPPPPPPNPFAGLTLNEDDEKEVLAKYMSMPPEVRAMMLKILLQLADAARARQVANNTIQQTTNQNPSPMVYCGTIGEELERRKREEEATQKGTISKFGVG